MPEFFKRQRKKKTHRGQAQDFETLGVQAHFKCHSEEHQKDQDRLINSFLSDTLNSGIGQDSNCANHREYAAGVLHDLAETALFQFSHSNKKIRPILKLRGSELFEFAPGKQDDVHGIVDAVNNEERDGDSYKESGQCFCD